MDYKSVPLCNACIALLVLLACINIPRSCADTIKWHRGVRLEAEVKEEMR